MTVGLFLESLDEEYQINVYRGVRDACRDRGDDLVCVQGEVAHTAGGPARRFDLAHRIRLDGLLILSSVAVSGLEGAGRATLSGLLPSLPTVSIGIPLDGTLPVTVRPGRTMSRLLGHLVDHHRYRRFLYLGGPPRHPDNRSRERAFLRAMQQARRGFPDIEWTVDHGGFYEGSGSTVIRRYLEGPPFDAVVAANDNMALGVQRVLAAQPDPRWRRCAVTGYDDISQALVASPPLTTVHTPLEELGARSVEALADLVAGLPPVRRSVVSRLVVRSSCGCEPPPGPAAPGDLPPEALRLRFLEAEQWLREGNVFGMELSGCTQWRALNDRLDQFLAVLGVQHFFLLIDGRLRFERVSGVRTPLSDEGLELDLPGLFNHRATRSEPPRVLCTYHLRSEARSLGLAVYSVEDNRLAHLTAALHHVAGAALRILNQDGQEARSRLLSDLVRARTGELTAANQLLQEEVLRRRAAEEEVLQVSELERQRFGLDLHDDICQRLAGVSMYLRSLASHPGPGDPAALAEVGSLLDETLWLTRQYAHASFPIDLETRGLDDVLRSLCHTVARQKGVPCDYGCDPRLPSALTRKLPALHLYRIVQEALQNAARHARARRLKVGLALRNERVTLTVTDDGVGFPADLPRSSGYGLRSMAYRAAQLGGRLEVTSRPGRGTVVRVSIAAETVLDLGFR